MNITANTLSWWRARQRVPSWARTLLEKQATAHVRDGAEINTVINDNARLREKHYARRERDSALQSTLSIARSANKRGALIQVLESMASNPQTNIGPKRRQAFCRKWLARIYAEHPCIRIAEDHGARLTRRSDCGVNFGEWVVLDQPNTVLWTQSYKDLPTATRAYCKMHKLGEFAD